MTNYERIVNPSIEDLAILRTKCIDYSDGYTYLNDAGRFEPEEIGGDPYEEAIQGEIKWLNKESTWKK